EEHRDLTHQHGPPVRDEQQDDGSGKRREEDDAEKIAFRHGRSPPPAFTPPSSGRVRERGLFAPKRTAFIPEPRSSRSVSAWTDPLILFRKGAGYRPIQKIMMVSATAMPHSRGCKSDSGVTMRLPIGPKNARS